MTADDWPETRDYHREQAGEIERLRERVVELEGAMLTAEMMLSEMGLASAEKCQMAYDYLNAYRAVLAKGESRDV